MNQETTNAQNETLTVGLCTLDFLQTQSPYAQWFVPEFEAYQSQIQDFAPEEVHHLRFKIFFGSWCGDTQRELPRFMRLLSDLGCTASQYELIGVDRRKQSGQGWEKGYGITRVPSILVYRKQRYLGRIVEKPKQSLEADLHAILSQK